MPAPGPRAVSDIPSTVGCHLAATAVLNTDIETLTAFKDAVEVSPVKEIFESIIAILTLVKVGLLVLLPFLRSLIGDEVVEKDSVVELTRTCVRACHVLKTATDGRNVEGLSDPSQSQIEDFGRCVNLMQHPPLMITNDIRTVRHIESTIRERTNCNGNLRKTHPESIEECLLGWQAEMLEGLRILDVRGSPAKMLAASNLPQGGLEAGEVRLVGRSVSTESVAPASVVR